MLTILEWKEFKIVKSGHSTKRQNRKETRSTYLLLLDSDGQGLFILCNGVFNITLLFLKLVNVIQIEL